MSAYDTVVRLARLQAEAIGGGDIDTAVRLIDRRAEILADAPPARLEDAEAIRETLALDRLVAATLAQHMASLRGELASAQRGRTALSAYRPGARDLRLGLDASR
jgi:hypothetical protein